LAAVASVTAGLSQVPLGISAIGSPATFAPLSIRPQHFVELKYQSECHRVFATQRRGSGVANLADVGEIVVVNFYDLHKHHGLEPLRIDELIVR
jgi:hypothetical protein